MNAPRDYLLYQGYEESYREKHESKRNEVYYALALNQDCYTMEYILKNTGDTEFEYSLITHLFTKGVSVPKVLAQNRDTIMLEFVAGDTLYRTLQLLEKNCSDYEPPLDALKSWLAEYYIAAKTFEKRAIASKCDLNLKNFIYDVKKNKITGLDFEDGDYNGTQKCDMHMVAAHILTVDPIFTEYKRRAAKYFLGDDYDKDLLLSKLQNIKDHSGIEFKINDELL